MFWIHTTGILARHILRSFLVPFFCCLGGFVLLFVIGEMQDDLSDLLTLKDPLQIMGFFLLSIPTKLNLILPMAVLLGAMYSFAQLNRTHEITAIRAAGISVMRLCLPVYLFAGLLGALTFANMQVVEPWCRERLQAYDALVKKKDEKPREINYTYRTKDGTRLWSMSQEPGGRLRAILVTESDQKGNIQWELAATSGRFSPGLGFYLQDVDKAMYRDGQLDRRLPRAPEMFLPFPEEDPQRFLHKSGLSAQVNLTQIAEELGDGRRVAPQRQRLLELRRWEIIFSPLGCLVAICLGIPMAITGQRQIVVAAAFRSLLIMMAYYVLMQVCTSLGKKGLLEPLLCYTLVPFAFISWGLWKSLKE